MKHPRSLADPSSFAERQRAEIARLRLPPQRIRRESLLRRLDRLEPLTFLHSLPGTGKTTVLADWAIHRMDAGDAIVWITGAEKLNSLDRFLAAVADIVLGPISAETSAAGSAAQVAAERRACLAQICLEKPQRRVILIVDNAEHFHDRDIHSWMLGLLDKHPNLHIAAAFDRVQQLNGLAKATRMSVSVVSGQHLMIPRSQAAAFAASWGHEISREQIERLHSEAGGWLLLLRTILDTPSAFIGESAVLGMERFRDDHLHEKVNGRLVATAAPMALLDEVSVDLVEVLYSEVEEIRRESAGATGRESVQQLVDSGMLRPSDTAPSGDRLYFPGAVRAYLAHLVETLDPRTAKVVHAAVAAYYERAGSPEDSARLLRHARRAEDWELLNRTAARQGWWLAVRHQRAAHEAFSEIPESALQRYPVLMMTHALAHALPVATIDPSPRSPMVQRALASAPEFHLDPAGGSADPNELAFLASAAMHGRRQRGDFDGAMQSAERFRNAVLRAHSSGLTALNTAMYYLQSGLSELMMGELDRAVRRFTRAYEESASTQAQFVAVSAAGHNALIFAYEGRRTVAEQWLDRANRGLEQVPWARPLIKVPIVLAAANLAMDAFDAEQARRHLDDAGSLLDVTEVWAFNANAQARFALLFGSPASTLSSIEHAGELRAERSPLGPLSEALLMRARADLLLSDGELNRAEQVITAGIGRDPSRAFESECTLARRSLFVAYARLCLVSGSYAAARQAASTALARKQTQRKMIDLLLIDAAAAHAMGSASDAAKSFRRALALARRAGIPTTLLALDRSTRQSLLDLVADDPGFELPTSVHYLLDSPGVYPAHSELVVLTERERAVLRELAGGASIPDIARTQVLSVNTVKKQTVSLYKKLGADNRMDALRRAFELRLIG
jgi:LuxR family transcriptional regulator, maltose regulon positive regulatory protein